MHRKLVLTHAKPIQDMYFNEGQSFPSGFRYAFSMSKIATENANQLDTQHGQNVETKKFPLRNTCDTVIWFEI